MTEVRDLITQTAFPPLNSPRDGNSQMDSPTLPPTRNAVTETASPDGEVLDRGPHSGATHVSYCAEHSDSGNNDEDDDTPTAQPFVIRDGQGCKPCPLLQFSDEKPSKDYPISVQDDLAQDEESPISSSSQQPSISYKIVKPTLPALFRCHTTMVLDLACPTNQPPLQSVTGSQRRPTGVKAEPKTLAPERALKRAVAHQDLRRCDTGDKILGGQAEGSLAAVAVKDEGSQDADHYNKQAGSLLRYKMLLPDWVRDVNAPLPDANTSFMCMPAVPNCHVMITTRQRKEKNPRAPLEIQEKQEHQKEIVYQEAAERQQSAIEAVRARVEADQEDHLLTAAAEGDDQSAHDQKTENDECKAMAVQAGTLRSGKRRRSASADQAATDHLARANPTKRGCSRKPMPKRVKKH